MAPGGGNLSAVLKKKDELVLVYVQVERTRLNRKTSFTFRHHCYAQPKYLGRLTVRSN